MSTIFFPRVWFVIHSQVQKGKVGSIRLKTGQFGLTCKFIHSKNIDTLRLRIRSNLAVSWDIFWPSQVTLPPNSFLGKPVLNTAQSSHSVPSFNSTYIKWNIATF